MPAEEIRRTGGGGCLAYGAQLVGVVTLQLVVSMWIPHVPESPAWPWINAVPALTAVPAAFLVWHFAPAAQRTGRVLWIPLTIIWVPLFLLGWVKKGLVRNIDEFLATGLLMVTLPAASCALYSLTLMILRLSSTPTTRGSG